MIPTYFFFLSRKYAITATPTIIQRVIFFPVCAGDSPDKSLGLNPPCPAICTFIVVWVAAVSVPSVAVKVMYHTPLSFELLNVLLKEQVEAE